MSFGQGVYIFKESPKSIQVVSGDIYCPCKYCFNTEKCDSLDGYVTTPRTVYGCGKRGAWSFVQKVLFMLQKHVKMTKTDKTRFFFAKKTMNLVFNKQLLLNVPFQSTKYGKKELCADYKVQETIGDAYCPTCRNEKCVYNSTNETISFYDCKKCKACCDVLNIPFKDQKTTNMLFGGDGTHCFQERRVATTKKKSHLHF